MEWRSAATDANFKSFFFSKATIGNSTKNKTRHFSKSKKTFDAVERKMNYIQASFSTIDLTNRSKYGTHDSVVRNSKKDLEAKEMFSHK